MKIAVVILAGGEGRRIGGAKPLRQLGRERLIDRATAIAAQWSDLVAVAVRSHEQAEGAGVRCIFDEPGVQGPLAGLIVGLRFAAASGCEGLLTIPADMPFLPSDLAARLMAAGSHGQAVVASSSGRLHPVCAFWPSAALEKASPYLGTGRRSLRGFAEAVGFQTVDWPAEPTDPFFNINAIEDLAVAETLLR